MTKNKMITKSMKYRIKYNKELYKVLRDIQYDSWLIKNRAISMAWDWQQFSFGYNERFGEFPKEKDILGTVLMTDIYQQLRKMGDNMSSSTYNGALKESVDKFKEQKTRMLRGEESIVSYKRNGSFPIRATQIKDIEKINSKTYSAKLSLLSAAYVKKYREELKLKNDKLIEEGKTPKDLSLEIKTQLPVVLMSGRGANEIIDRIIEGKYKLCDSRITIDRKNRFFLSIVYQFEKESVKTLDVNRIMGIDVGVNTPAYLAVSDDDYYRMEVGSIDEIKGFQNQMNKRTKSMQRQRKWAGQGSVGHGTKTRIKPLEKLSGKIQRFKDSKNHNWSRYIINEAIKNNCGAIQMEDLTGINERHLFLKTWTYYDLQEKIRYKAEEAGIEVLKIKLNHTSARCNQCGHIHKSEDVDTWRPKDGKDKSRDKFECMKCDWGHRFYVNADWNAARNISIKGIDKIIEEDKKKQESEMRHNMKYVV